MQINFKSPQFIKTKRKNRIIISFFRKQKSIKIRAFKEKFIEIKINQEKFNFVSSLKEKQKQNLTSMRIYQ